jgi:phosphate butyryltransferase
MGYERPKAAALCAVETLNPKMPETEEAKKLAELAKEGAFGPCILEGPISMDISVSAEIAKLKGYESQIAGDTDIFLMPDIAAGNIMSKAIMLLGGAKMAGCVLGAKAPVILVSRGASAEEKYLSIVLALSAKG